MTGAPRLFDRLPDGRAIHEIGLAGPVLSLRLLTLGATVRDLRRADHPHPLVLGFDHARPYLDKGLYVGAIVGRFANRIGGARFRVDGTAHDVDRNFLGRHLLHGGADGTHRHIWRIEGQTADRARLSLDLPDGHMGFPGAMRIEAEFAVPDDALHITLRATTDRTTPCNLTHHGYFDLDGAGDVRDHKVQIAAGRYLPVDADLIPTGAVVPVAGTPFDFRTPRRFGGGYDHNLCLAPARRAVTPVAHLQGRDGTRMIVETTEPGLQVYDGRHFDGMAGLDGRRYGPYAGLALEAQGWPDAPNHPAFPDSLLHPGAVREATTRYRFPR